MIPAWRPYVWRWFTHRRENTPKIVSSMIFLAIFSRYIHLSYLSPESLPGFTNDIEAEYEYTFKTLLDDEKIVELARRRAEMLGRRQEAEEYFARFGKTRVPTGQFIVRKDNLGY